MKRIVVCTLMVGVVGCDLLGKKDGAADAAPAASVTAVATAGGLPPECESFLTQYSCFLTKSGKPTTEADDMRKQWTGTPPAAMPAILTTCKTQLTTQADNFKKMGCVGAAATAATAAASTVAPPTPKAAADAAAPAARAAKYGPCTTDADCPKGTLCYEVAGKDVCLTSCDSTPTFCEQNEACDVQGKYLKTGGVGMVCTKPVRNVAEGGVCKVSSDCANPQNVCVTYSAGTLCRASNCSKCPPMEECSKEKGTLAGAFKVPQEFCVPKAK